MVSEQEQVPTAQHSLHMANGLGKRAQDPGVELARWLLRHTCHCEWQDILVSTVQKTLGFWVSPAGHLVPGCDPTTSVGQSHCVFALYKVTAMVCLSTTWTKAWPSVVPPLSRDYGNWFANVPECP